MTKTVMAAEYAVLIFCMPKYNEIVDVPSCTALNLKSSKHGMESICMNLHEDVEHNRMLIIPISSKTSFWYERT